MNERAVLLGTSSGRCSNVEVGEATTWYINCTNTELHFSSAFHVPLIRASELTHDSMNQKVK